MFNQVYNTAIVAALAVLFAAGVHGLPGRSSTDLTPNVLEESSNSVGLSSALDYVSTTSAIITFKYACAGMHEQLRELELDFYVENNKYIFKPGPGLIYVSDDKTLNTAKALEGSVLFTGTQCVPAATRAGQSCQYRFTGAVKTGLKAGESNIAAYVVPHRLPGLPSPAVQKICRWRGKHSDRWCPPFGLGTQYCEVKAVKANVQ